MIGKIETEFSCFPIQAVQFGKDLTLVAICGEVVVDYSLLEKGTCEGQRQRRLDRWVLESRVWLPAQSAGLEARWL